MLFEVFPKMLFIFSIHFLIGKALISVKEVTWNSFILSFEQAFKLDMLILI